MGGQALDEAASTAPILCLILIDLGEKPFLRDLAAWTAFVCLWIVAVEEDLRFRDVKFLHQHLDQTSGCGDDFGSTSRLRIFVIVVAQHLDTDGKAIEAACVHSSLIQRGEGPSLIVVDKKVRSGFPAEAFIVRLKIQHVLRKESLRTLSQRRCGAMVDANGGRTPVGELNGVQIPWEFKGRVSVAEDLHGLSYEARRCRPPGGCDVAADTAGVFRFRHLPLTSRDSQEMACSVWIRYCLAVIKTPIYFGCEGV